MLHFLLAGSIPVKKSEGDLIFFSLQMPCPFFYMPKLVFFFFCFYFLSSVILLSSISVLVIVGQKSQVCGMLFQYGFSYPFFLISRNFCWIMFLIFFFPCFFCLLNGLFLSACLIFFAYFQCLLFFSQTFFLNFFI